MANTIYDPPVAISQNTVVQPCMYQPGHTLEKGDVVSVYLETGIAASNSTTDLYTSAKAAAQKGATASQSTYRYRDTPPTLMTSIPAMAHAADLAVKHVAERIHNKIVLPPWSIHLGMYC